MNIKLSIVIVIVLTFYNVCFSQENKEEFRKGYITVGIGPAIPISQFRNNDVTNSKAGFAETGLSFSIINIGYRFRIIEITGLLMGSAHFLSLETNSNNDAAWVYSGAFLGATIPIDISRKLQTGIKVML